jgi:hypothetical protein
MDIRIPTNHDLEKISYLDTLQEGFKLRNTDNMIIERLVMDKDEPIAYGIVKGMAEAIILTNPKYPQATRAKAMAELMNYAEFGTARAGLAQLHCFTDSEKIARTLERKFGFVRTSSAVVLVKNVDNYG